MIYKCFDFISAALDYFKHNPIEPVDRAKFVEHCGLGVVITPDQVEEVVEKVISHHRDGLMEQRYKYNMGLIIGKL